MAEVTISVDGRPPKKSEAYSLLNEKHPKASQVLALLEAVLAVVGPDFAPYKRGCWPGGHPVGP